jgi:hypothetical protein
VVSNADFWDHHRMPKPRRRARALTFDEFTATLGDAAPPPDLPLTLQALWHDRHGNWDRAHRITQDIEDATGSLIHAYLHRREGDLPNATYWYTRAGEQLPNDDTDREWERLVRSLLGA